MKPQRPLGHELVRFLRQAKLQRLKIQRQWREKTSHHKTSCTVGCDWCCYQLVMAGLYEGTMLAFYLALDGQMDRLEAFIDQGEEQEALLCSYGPDDAATVWFDRQVACPLLHDHRCVLYPMRPMACATYCVVSPSENCQPPSGKMVAAVNAMLPITSNLLLDGQFLVMLEGCGVPVDGHGPAGVSLPLGAQVATGIALLGRAGLIRGER
jgi:Fe-S-cluster containining protein